MWPSCSQNQREPSGAVAMPPSALFTLPGSWKSMSAPAVVMRPMRFVLFCVNHSAPSLPTVRATGKLSGLKVAYSFMTVNETGDKTPIFETPASVNQKLPSGPRTI